MTGGQVVSTKATGTVVTAPRGRGTFLGIVGGCAILATFFLVLYLVSPETMGPSPERPHADSVADVFVAFIVAWSLTAMLWAVLERKVSVEDDQILIVRGTGRKVVLSRS